VILLIPSDRFIPRRRPRTARDELPLRPLLQVLAFWVLLATGGLFAAVAAMEIWAHFALEVTLDRPTTVLMIVMAALSPICISTAMVFWFRLRR
jgi:hypothetical protein